jgi:hypothetical protein
VKYAAGYSTFQWNSIALSGISGKGIKIVPIFILKPYFLTLIVTMVLFRYAGTPSLFSVLKVLLVQRKRHTPGLGNKISTEQCLTSVWEACDTRVLWSLCAGQAWIWVWLYSLVAPLSQASCLVLWVSVSPTEGWSQGQLSPGLLCYEMWS